MRGELRPLLESALLGGDDREQLFVAGELDALWQRFLAGRAPWRPVWSLALLRAWIAGRRVPSARGNVSREIVVPLSVRVGRERAA
jgi:hypothetical protein